MLVTGRDDPDTCFDTRSCTSRGECVAIDAKSDVDKWGAQLGATSPSLAQTITIARAGTLIEVRLNVFNESGLDAIALDVTLNGVDSAGLPSAETIERLKPVTISPPSLIGSYVKFKPFEPPMPIAVSAGQRIAIVVRTSSGSSNVGQLRYGVVGTDLYAGGQAYKWDDAAATWTDLRNDFDFMTLVKY